MATIHYKKVIDCFRHYLAKDSSNKELSEELNKFYLYDIYNYEIEENSEHTNFDAYTEIKRQVLIHDTKQAIEFYNDTYRFQDTDANKDQVLKANLRSRKLVYKKITEFNTYISKKYDLKLLMLAPKIKKEIPYNSNNSTKKVFLSYAYDDKFYTLALFYYFLSKGMLLSVDWIQHTKGPNGAYIKSDLQKDLQGCQKLIFLRSMHSELRIEGHQSVRQWCSWEIGAFYQIQKMRNHSKHETVHNMYYTDYLMTSGKQNSFLDDLTFIRSTKLLK